MKLIISKKNAFYLFIIILCTIPTTSNAQYWMTKFGHLENYYLIKDSTEKFFNDDTARIHDRNLGYKSYQRWRTFMESRVDNNGSLATYHQNMANEYDNILLTDNDRIPGQWNNLGPVTGTTGTLAELGIVTSLLVEDNLNIYAGTGASGLFVTHDGGTTWNSLTDNYLITGIESIIKNCNTIYIATGFDTWGKVYSKGILKSTDNGNSWRETGLTSGYLSNKPFSVKGMVADPDSTKYFYAILQEQYRNAAHIVKSSDWCASWGAVPKFSKTNTDLRKIEIDPFNSNRLIASGRCVVISTDKGETWQDITDSIPYQSDTIHYDIVRISTSFHPNIPNRILVMLKKVSGSNNYLEFYISNDAGSNFTKCNYHDELLAPIASKYSEDKFELEWSQVDDEDFYYAGEWIFKMHLTSNNELFNIDNTGGGYHIDIRYLKVDKAYGDQRSIDVIYQGNDGGVTMGYESTESGYIWQDLSGTGLNITQFYGLAINESDPDFFLGGTQDGNLFIHNHQGWGNRSNIGDAAEAVIDYLNPNNIYMVAFCGGYYLNRSTDGGASWLPIKTWMPDEGIARRNDAPLEMSKVDPTILFIGGKQVYRSRSGQFIFDKISDFARPNNSYIKVIRVSPFNNNYIIAAKENMAWLKPENKNKINLTLNGGSKWYDVTPDWDGDFSLKDAGVFDIAIDPEKPSNFFVALDRFNANKKVFKGEWGYGGDTIVKYTNISDGLPNLPVNCIEIYKGSDSDEMFAGTDCGVYYFHNQIGHWVKYGHGMPVCAVSDLEINYSTNQLIASTFGRGMYSADLCEMGPSELDMYISDTLVWEDNGKRIPANIIIQPGGHLTIRGEVLMKYAKSIIVQPGAFLILDGGALTSHCATEPWGGIRVNGTPGGAQNPLYQGLVVLKNHAKIENAMVGIHSINPPQKDILPESGGGIILAVNSTFRNNRIAVQFEHYTYTSSISSFKNCIFETEDAPSNESYKYFVKINDVKGGLFFGGCTFRNILSPFSTSDQITKTGIDSYNSHFIVDWYCGAASCPDEYKSKFENLLYGIYAISLPGTRTFKVTNSKFTNNDCGIYALNIENADLRNNDFYITKVGDRNTGLYLDHCNGYIVEENDFFLSENGNVETTRGIYINESGPYDNTLYLNEFDNLAYGIVAEGCNRTSDGFYGLQIKCNTFISTINDITVLPIVISNTIGIAHDQGTANPKLCDQLAGNIFTQSAINQYHFYNGPSDRINYHYLRTNPDMLPRHNLRVEVRPEYPTYGGECCIPHEYGNGGGTTILDEATLENRANYLEVKSVLNSLIDQGETENKLFSINTSIPDEGLTITQDLLQTSPYVSDTVIKKAIEKEDVINNSMLRDIMVANPNTGKSNEIMSYIDTRIEEMPQYMKDEILQGEGIQSEREVKEANYNIYRRAFQNGFDRHLTQLLTDTVKIEQDTLVHFFEKDGRFISLLKNGWVKFENGDTIQAINYLISMDTITLLDQIQVIELQEQSKFMQWLVENPVYDSSQTATLNLFSFSPSLKVSASAIGILLANNVSNYSEPYSVIDESKHSDPIKLKNEKRVENYLVVIPNPATDFITIKYSSKFRTSKLYIYNEAGKLLLKRNLHKEQDEITLSTRGFNPGIYLISLKNDQGFTKSSKFIISR